MMATATDRPDTVATRKSSWRRFGKRSALSLSFGIFLALIVSRVGGGSADSQASDAQLLAGGNQLCAGKEPEPRLLSQDMVLSSTYDPVDMMLNDEAWAWELYDAEVRDDNWAPEMEQELAKQMRIAFGDVPGRRVDAINCRMNICKVAFSGNRTDSKDAQLSVQLPINLASAFALGATDTTDDRFSSKGYFVFRADIRAVPDYQERMRIARELQEEKKSE